MDRHWSLVRDGFGENFKNDLLWIIILRGVKVRDAIKNWGYINSDQCASCPRIETVNHCFLHCSRVKEVWSHFSPVLSSLLDVTFIPNCLFVYLFQWPCVNDKSSCLSPYLIKSILYGIWKFRNKSMFHNGNDNSRAIIQYILTDIQKRISTDHFRFSHNNFVTAWESPICSVSDTSFQILIR